MRIFIKSILFSWLFITSILSPAQAQKKPLKIAVTPFSYPFVMQGTNQLYGSDIAMMSYICPMIGRDCQYEVMDFNKIIPAVAANKVDIGVDGITITAERAKYVNFSIPYSVSETRFLGNINLSKLPFTLSLLEKSHIGLKTGTVFKDEISHFGIKNPNITTFDTEETLVEALINRSVDMILVDQPAAMYWQQQAPDKIAVLGHPVIYGFGYGIAVSPENPTLLTEINQALLQYKNSKEFQNNNLMYFNYF